MLEHLRGERSLPETAALVKTRTWQFARRQMTWFRNQMNDWLIAEHKQRFKGMPPDFFTCGGFASAMRSDFDPFLARLGIGAVGNVAWAGTVRTELLNGYRDLTCFRELCNGCRWCYEICPIGVWEMDEDKRAVAPRLESCTACRACLTQCPTNAIQAVPREI